MASCSFLMWAAPGLVAACRSLGEAWATCLSGSFSRLIIPSSSATCSIRSFSINSLLLSSFARHPLRCSSLLLHLLHQILLHQLPASELLRQAPPQMLLPPPAPPQLLSQLFFLFHGL